MSDHHDELPTLAAAALDRVTGGAGFDPMMMLPLLAARRSQSAPPPPPQQPLTPTIKVNGVEQQLTNNGNGSYSLSTGDPQQSDADF